MSLVLLLKDTIKLGKDRVERNLWNNVLLEFIGIQWGRGEVTGQVQEWLLFYFLCKIKKNSMITLHTVKNLIIQTLIVRNTVKPVLSSHSKIDKTKILMTNGSLMKVESITECSLWSILQYFWPALSANQSWKPIFGLLFEWPLKTGFTVYANLC